MIAAAFYVCILDLWAVLDSKLMMTMMIIINTHSAANKLLFVADPVQCNVTHITCKQAISSDARHVTY